MTREDELYADELRDRAYSDYERLDLAIQALEAQPTDAKETIIKSALKYLVKRQIAEGSVGFAVDNDPDHDCCWDDVLAWLEAQPCEDAVSRQAVLDGLASIAKAKAKSDAQKYLMGRVMFFTEQLPTVTPQRPKGKWIRVVDKAGHWVWECDCKWQQRFATNFCPNCGSYNAEIKESAADDAFSD